MQELSAPVSAGEQGPGPGTDPASSYWRGTTYYRARRGLYNGLGAVYPEDWEEEERRPRERVHPQVGEPEGRSGAPT